MDTPTFSMDNLLPTDIKLEIFSRLPADSVLQCRQVCKSWRKLLHHPQFVHMHLCQSLELDKVGILYRNGKRDDYDNQFYYGEYDENEEQSYKTLKRINHPRVTCRATVVGSCNGLICLSLQSRYYDINDCIYICNPITREYVNLPIYDIAGFKQTYAIHGIFYGFGYLPSTNEYKVVRILFHSGIVEYQTSDPVGSVEVYTLGGGSGWRNKGEAMFFMSSWDCVFANGALHWIDDENMKILAFDLADEEFRLLPSPPCFVPGEDNSFRLKVLGGLLCLVHEKIREGVINIWLFKKGNIRNTTYVMEEQQYQSWSWHREFRMAWEGMEGNPYDLFAFTKSGEVLLWYKILGIRFSDDHKHSILSRYDPNAGTLKKFDTDMLFLDAFPHLNSLISLKAIGEEGVKIIGSAEEKLELETFDCPSQEPEDAFAVRYILGDGRWLVLRRRELLGPIPYWVNDVENYHLER